MGRKLPIDSFELVLDDLSSLVERLALEVPKIQRVLDQAAIESLEAASRLPEWPEGLRALQPIGPRLAIRDLSIDCAVEVELTREKRFAVGILGAGFSKLSKRRSEDASRLQIDVHVVPQERSPKQ